jgi:hypothetical protein
MKQFYMGSYPCYEFQADETLVSDVLNFVKGIDYAPIGSPIDGMSNIAPDRMTVSHMGYDNTEGKYKSFYHKELYNYLQNCLDQVATKHFSHLNLKMCDLWPTKTTFGQKSNSHSHMYSIFSGLLYLTDTTNSKTIFTIPDMFYEHWSHFMGEGIIKQDQEIKISAEKGKLIIWPSMIRHKISVHTEKDTRHTVAFNSMINGASHIFTGRLKIKVEGPDKNFYE